MRLRTPLLFPAAAIAAVLFATASDALAQNIRILRKSGKVVTASKIEKDDITAFSFDPVGSSKAQDIDPTDVYDVVWENAGEFYTNALDALGAADYDNAIQSLEAAVAKADDPIFKRYATRDLVRAHLTAGTGDTSSPHNTKAKELARQFIDENPNARLNGDMRLLLGRAEMQAGDYTSAEQTLKSLENDARAKFGQDMEVKAKRWAAQNLEEKGNFAEARNMYSSLATTAGSALTGVADKSLLQKELQSMQRLGQIRQGVCSIEADQTDEAERYFSRLLTTAERANDPALIAGAHNGLGMVAFNKGEIKKARLEFTIVSVKYPHDPAETLQALYWIGQCYEKLDGDEPGARARAAEYYREVVERNQASRLNSPWAAKAKKRI